MKVTINYLLDDRVEEIMISSSMFTVGRKSQGNTPGVILPAETGCSRLALMLKREFTPEGEWRVVNLGDSPLRAIVLGRLDVSLPPFLSVRMGTNATVRVAPDVEITFEAL
jgi:hypothetical protein